MPDIHPTAIVDPDAELGSDVTIGPFCIVHGHAKLGDGTRLISHCVLEGPLVMGPGNTVYPGVTLGMQPQDRKVDDTTPNSGLIIGAENVFRESVTIHRGSHARGTTLGDRNYFMACSHIAHDCLVGDDCMFANNALVGGHCDIGNQVIFGGGAGVQQFCRIGRISFISGVEGVVRDLPPFCMVHHTKMVSSLNLVGLRRAGYRENIDNVRRAFNILYLRGLPNSAAVARIYEEVGDDPLCAEMADFVAASTRGICTYGDSKTFRIRGSKACFANSPATGEEVAKN